MPWPRPRTLNDAIVAALQQADALFGAKTALSLADATNNLVPHYAGTFALDDRERGVAGLGFPASAPGRPIH